MVDLDTILTNSEVLSILGNVFHVDDLVGLVIINIEEIQRRKHDLAFLSEDTFTANLHFKFNINTHLVMTSN